MHSAANSRNRVGGFRPSTVGSLFSFSLDMTRHTRYEKRPTEIFRNDLPRLVNSGQKIVPISRALSLVSCLAADRLARPVACRARLVLWQARGLLGEPPTARL